MNFEKFSTECLNDKDTPWIPFTPYDERVLIKYFKIDPVQGETVMLLRSPSGAEMARHHHTGSVIVFTLRGRWRYKEHNWIAEAGSVVYEAASSRHTPIALPGAFDVVTFNVVRGELVYLDSDENVVAVENWRTALQRYRAYCRNKGVRERDLTGLAA